MPAPFYFANYGMVIQICAVDETEVDAFRTLLDTNVVGTWTGQHVMPAWRKSIHPSGLRNWRKSLRRCFGYVPRGAAYTVGHDLVVDGGASV